MKLEEFKVLIKSYQGKTQGLHSFLKNKYPESIKFINDNCPDCIKNYPFLHKVFWLINDITDFPRCAICGKPNKRKINLNGYQGIKKCCSQKCSLNSSDTLEKRKKTCIEKYGVSCPTKNIEVQRKSKQSWKKYSKDDIKKFRNKAKKTTKEKYGKEFYSQTNEFKKEFKKAMNQKYGVDNPTKSKEILEKVKKTNLKKYGTEWSMQSKKVQRKVKETSLKRYGVKYPIAAKETRLKIEDTNRKKYNSTCSLCNPKVKEKATKTMIKRYGAKNVSQVKSIMSKIALKNKKIGYRRLLSNNYVEPLFTFEFYQKHDYNYPFQYKCKKCGRSFKASRDSNFHRLPRCRKCYPTIHNKSKQEDEVFQYINGLIECNQTNKNIIFPYEVDIYIPSKQLAIEYDGLFWHSSQNKVPPKYHIRKSVLCKQKGIQLIHIFEDEWLYKKDIVKKFLRRQLVSDYNLIDLAQCEKKNVSLKEAVKFHNSNSLSPFNIDCDYHLIYNHNNQNILCISIKDNCIVNHSINLDFGIVNFTSILKDANVDSMLLDIRLEDFNLDSSDYLLPRKYCVKYGKRYRHAKSSCLIFDCGLVKMKLPNIIEIEPRLNGFFTI